MAKYLVMMEDFPTEKWDGCMQLIRYSGKEEYLTMEHRWINDLSNKDVSKKNSSDRFEFEEIAANNEDIKKLRDFLNSLDLDENTKENDPEERKCLGCEIENESIHMFKGKFYDEDLSEFVEEIYCNDCLANILTEEPNIISDLEAI